MEYSSRMKELGLEIKKVRKEKGISQNTLITMLQDRMDGSSIGRNSLSMLENGNVANLKSSLKTLYAIGEILDVDIDYFIGKQEHKSLDRHDISMYTGLSDEAVANLHKLSSDFQTSQVISAFFTSPHFKAILYAGMALDLSVDLAQDVINEEKRDLFLLKFAEYDINERRNELLKWISLFVDEIFRYEDIKYDLQELRRSIDNGKQKT